MIRIVLLLMAFSGAAAAQDRIPAEEFLDQLAGRTATFTMYGTDTLVGVEQFLRRDRTVWARANGSCAYGRVTVRGAMVCFSYDDEPDGRAHCWVPFVEDGALLVLNEDGNEVQAITALTDKPISCTPPPTS